MKRLELAELFFREARRFARRYPNVRDVRLGIEYGKHILPGHRAYRDLGYAEIYKRPPIVVLHHRVLRMPIENVIGLIRHELGHVADPTPWRGGAEQRADDIAERVTWRKIRYDPRDVQTIGKGTYPRPTYLHQ